MSVIEIELTFEPDGVVRKEVYGQSGCSNVDRSAFVEEALGAYDIEQTFMNDTDRDHRVNRNRNQKE